MLSDTGALSLHLALGWRSIIFFHFLFAFLPKQTSGNRSQCCGLLKNWSWDNQAITSSCLVWLSSSPPFFCPPGQDSTCSPLPMGSTLYTCHRFAFFSTDKSQIFGLLIPANAEILHNSTCWVYQRKQILF